MHKVIHRNCGKLSDTFCPKRLCWLVMENISHITLIVDDSIGNLNEILLILLNEQISLSANRFTTGLKGKAVCFI